MHGNHAALLLLSGGGILQEESLFRSNHALQRQQRAMRIYHKSFRVLVKLRTLGSRPVDHNGNVQINPPAAPAFQPGYFGRFLIAHTYSG